MSRSSSLVTITILLFAAVALGFAVPAPGAMMVPEFYPWQLLTKCSDVEVYLSQSRPTATASSWKVRLRARNLNDVAVDLSVAPRVRTDDGQERTLPSQTIRVSADQDLVTVAAQWETSLTNNSPDSTSELRRVVAWGFDEVQVKKVETDVPAVSCSEPITPTTPASIAATLNALSLVAVDRDNVPLAARDRLVDLKDQLAVLILGAANETGAADPVEVKSLIFEMLQFEGVMVGPSALPIFGGIRDLKIEAFAGHPDLLGATTVFSLPNSDDSSLRLLARTDRSWRTALAVENRSYEKIGDALGRLTYAVSPAVMGQPAFVVVADVTPRGETGPFSIRHGVYLPSVDSGNPRLIDQDTARYCGAERTIPAFSIFPDATGVVIRYSDGTSSLVSHQPLIKYAYEGGDVRKVISLEQSARDFIDEWVSLTSTVQAAALIEPIALEIVNCRRGALQAANFRPSAQTNTVRICPTDKCQFQMAVRLNDGNNLFFTVVRRRDGFHAQHINNVQPVRCDVKAP